MNEYIELVEQKDIFGFPACVYRFKKHNELKENMINYLGSRSFQDALLRVHIYVLMVCKNQFCTVITKL